MKRNPRVCISAGHGMSSRTPGRVDPGASVKGSKSSEARIARTISIRLTRDLRTLFRLCGGAVMFRDAGHFSRADDDAVKFGADLFVEIHLNAGGGTGTEVLYNAESGKRLAQRMSKMIAGALVLRNRGAKRRGDLAVLAPKRGMVQVLAEMFFADSSKDVAAYRKRKTAMEIATLNAMLDHFGWPRVKTVPRLWGPIRKRRYRRKLS